MIKLAAFDVDGTLRDRDYLPDSTRAALARLKQQGIALALCTGRSEYEMRSLCEELGIDWAITCNGSHIGYQGKTVFANAFPKDIVREWLNNAEKQKHTLLLYGSEKMYMTQPDDPYFRQGQREIGFMEPAPWPSGGDAPEIYQCIAFCEEHEEAVYTGGEKDRYYVHRWRPWAVDINPNGMNKAVGLRKLMDHLNIAPEEAAAFGDGNNDFEMIELVGSGIAMGNAVDDLKTRARFVTRSLQEDGIAYAVDKWILTGTG